NFSLNYNNIRLLDEFNIDNNNYQRFYELVTKKESDPVISYHSHEGEIKHVLSILSNYYILDINETLIEPRYFDLLYGLYCFNYRLKIDKPETLNKFSEIYGNMKTSINEFL